MEDVTVLFEKKFVWILRVLHVVNWYPSEPNPNEALWIKRHIVSLKGLVEEQFVLHIEVKPFNKFRFFRDDNESLTQRIFFWSYYLR